MNSFPAVAGFLFRIKKSGSRKFIQDVFSSEPLALLIWVNISGSPSGCVLYQRILFFHALIFARRYRFEKGTQGFGLGASWQLGARLRLEVKEMSPAK
ncbi:MAG: hypothetical protein HY231_25270 [Acidobacteria bacterium]|nr:hypothetical protein [Acidobacteriota bacterium]